MVAAVFLALAVVLGAGENLLANGGFDLLGAEGLPRDWDVYVMPMAGAEGAVTDAGREGQAVMLHNPREYERDPANNWSQTLLGEYVGLNLTISGYIKTEGATEAALWLQCWRRDPPMVVAIASTSVETPIRGDTDWTFVEASVQAPEGTDFLIVRCVLRGRGTAWFDDMTVAGAGDGDGAVAVAEAEDVEGAPAADDTGQQLREMSAALQESNASLREQLAVLEREVSALREQPRTEPSPTTVVVEPQGGESQGHEESAGAGALGELRASNELLREQVARVEADLRRLAVREPAGQPAASVVSAMREVLDRVESELRDLHKVPAPGRSAQARRGMMSRLEEIEADLEELRREHVAHWGDLGPAESSGTGEEVREGLARVQDALQRLEARIAVEGRLTRDEKARESLETVREEIQGLSSTVEELSRAASTRSEEQGTRETIVSPAPARGPAEADRETPPGESSGREDAATPEGEASVQTPAEHDETELEALLRIEGQIAERSAQLEEAASSDAPGTSDVAALSAELRGVQEELAALRRESAARWQTSFDPSAQSEEPSASGKAETAAVLERIETAMSALEERVQREDAASATLTAVQGQLERIEEELEELRAATESQGQPELPTDEKPTSVILEKEGDAEAAAVLRGELETLRESNAGLREALARLEGEVTALREAESAAPETGVPAEPTNPELDALAGENESLRRRLSALEAELEGIQAGRERGGVRVEEPTVIKPLIVEPEIIRPKIEAPPPKYGHPLAPRHRAEESTGGARRDT